MALRKQVPDAEATTQYCPRCKQEKIVLDFKASSCYCRLCRNEYAKERRKRPGMREKDLEFHRLYYKNNKEKCNEISKQYFRELRVEVIQAYGGICECCSERKIEFLSIDHINGRGHGARHRELVGGSQGVYQDLRKRGFPKGEYRILCMNCNCSLGYYGFCPHNERPMEWL